MTEKPVDQQDNLRRPQLKLDAPLRMMETAFLASTASLIWFINFYFPLGPLLRIFFPVPIALVYLRWGKRAAWMAAVTSGLLLSVLMGPIRSLLFVMPFAFMGVLLGAAWYRRVPWIVSISLGTVLGTLGVFFRLWLLSLLSGEDLWVYVINQVTEIVEWIFLRLGILSSPSTSLINLGAIALIIFNNFLYLFIVHIAAWLLLDRLGNPIPRPPHWVQVLMDYE
ncbi:MULTISPECIES: DUF2232 domain-containing protein [Fischerella]|uniref:DUF2232 domain-containing protein n=1 Tax=Fischerella muscicola CCMEE 5323 TaxID=2019572 RepID=A0A2N6JVV8_FISMU|nr:MULTISPECIES: DUF2232 domain-containing protein [Fischerella]MBD2432450.1 DUF2232 domain-containing protein [Fischerella sp. FACHB-380]PLZ83888.1 DUF2232 domain-containing protein [Fischerella muscicola CCMEE 5323]